MSLAALEQVGEWYLGAVCERGVCLWRGEHVEAWSLPSQPLSVAVASLGGAPHALVVTEESHVWWLPFERAGERLLASPSSAPALNSTPPPAAPLQPPPPAAGCAWATPQRARCAGGEEAPGVTTDIAWPVAVVPLATAACVSGDALVITSQGAGPTLLSAADALQTPPLVAHLAMPALLEDSSYAAARPASRACLSARAPHAGACVAQGWAEVTARLAAALRLPVAGGRSHAAQRKACTACSCARWLLIGGDDGAVQAHAVHAPAPDCDGDGSLSSAVRLTRVTRPLFHLHQRCVLLAAISPDMLLLMGAAGRVVVASASACQGASAPLLTAQTRAPCARIAAACGLPCGSAGARIAAACEHGILLSSPLNSLADVPTLTWARISVMPHARGVACAGGRLFACDAEGEVHELSTSDAALAAPPPAPPHSALRVRRVLRELQAIACARDALRGRGAVQDGELAELSAALTAAAALRCGAAVTATLAHRDSAASGLLFVDVRNEGPRELSDRWSFAASMRSGDSSPCAFASAPLRGGVRPLGGTLRLALGLPGHMQPHRAAVHVTGWLIYTAQEGDVAPLLFPAMHTTLHVLHCAHSDALGGTPAAALAQGGAADAMAPLHLRVWLPAGTAAAEALAQCCGFVAGSASASAVAGARALLPCTAGAAPPGSLRCAMSREGAAHFTVAAGSEPHIAPLAREALLRRGQQWALAEPPPPPPPPPPLSEDAADALQDATRALRKQLVGCSDALDAVARLRALAADPRSSPLERQRAADAASEALQAAQTQLLTCYSALRSGTSAVSC